jgi:hypothetical protein
VTASENIWPPLFDVYVCAPPPLDATPVGRTTLDFIVLTAVAHAAALPVTMYAAA